MKCESLSILVKVYETVIKILRNPLPADIDLRHFVPKLPQAHKVLVQALLKVSGESHAA